MKYFTMVVVALAFCIPRNGFGQATEQILFSYPFYDVGEIPLDTTITFGESLQMDPISGSRFDLKYLDIAFLPSDSNVTVSPQSEYVQDGGDCSITIRGRNLGCISSHVGIQTSVPNVSTGNVFISGRVYMPGGSPRTALMSDTVIDFGLLSINGFAVVGVPIHFSSDLGKTTPIYLFGVNAPFTPTDTAAQILDGCEYVGYSFGFQPKSSGHFVDTVTVFNGLDSSTIILIGNAEAAGVERVANSPALTIYPNPCSESAHLEIPNPGVWRVDLYNTLGQKMLTKSGVAASGGAKIELNVSSLVIGVYMVKLESSTGSAMERITILR